MSGRYHLTVGGLPYCSWLGCAAGQDIAQESGVLSCSVEGYHAAAAAVAKLAPHFRVPVAVVEGDCPTMVDSGGPLIPMTGAQVIASAWTLNPHTDDESIIASVARWLDLQSPDVAASLAAHFEAEHKERTDEA